MSTSAKNNCQPASKAKIMPKYIAGLRNLVLYNKTPDRLKVMVETKIRNTFKSIV